MMLQRLLSYCVHFCGVKLRRLKFTLTIAITIAVWLQYKEYAKYAHESRKKKHLFFLKTHNTGSSTIQNILFRYGFRHNLTFALPSGRTCSFGYPLPITKRSILPPSEMHESADYDNKLSDDATASSFNNQHDINILAHHSRLNLDDTNIISKIFADDVVPFKFTILRDPTTLLPSAFNSYQHLRPIQLANHNISAFLEDPNKFYSQSHLEENKLDLALTRNGMTFDMGYAGVYTFSPPGIRQVIDEVDQFFDFVMLMEYFTESLVLLKHYLNWDIEDILHIPLNTRSAFNEPTITSDLVSKIRNWARVDTALYDHFNKTFWERVTEFGIDRMENEVELVNERLKKVEANCFEGKPDDPAALAEVKVPRANADFWIYSWLLKDEMLYNQFCQDIARTELPFSRMIYDRQYFGTSFDACGGKVGGGDSPKSIPDEDVESEVEVKMESAVHFDGAH